MLGDIFLLTWLLAPETIIGAFQVCKWKGTSLVERLLMEILSREVINVQGIGAIHKPVQRSSYCWDGPTDFGLIENTGSKFRELLKSRNEARSLLKKFPENNIKRKGTFFTSLKFSFILQFRNSNYWCFYYKSIYFLITGIKMFTFELKMVKRKFYWFICWLWKTLPLTTLGGDVCAPLLETELACL